MQDRYVADIGDFGKFQLFRYLFNASESPLIGKAFAQIWFLHDDETHNRDGSHTDYFDRVKGSDPYLESSLMTLLMQKRRAVSELQQLKLLENAKFFETKIPNNFEDRHLWLSSALQFSLYTQIVALAPDNGMALRCKREEGCFEHLSLAHDYRQKRDPRKYIFSDEVGYFYKLPHLEICIVYQHLSRCFAHDRQIEVLLDDLRARFGYVVAIKHRPYSPRAFFFLCKSDVIKESLEERLARFEKRFSESWKLFR